MGGWVGGAKCEETEAVEHQNSNEDKSKLWDVGLGSESRFWLRMFGPD